MKSKLIVIVLSLLMTSSAFSQDLAPVFSRQFFDNAGKPCASCLLYTYASGTSVSLTTYSNEALTIPNGSPIVLDSSGRAPMLFMAPYAYKFVLKTALGVTIKSEDPIVNRLSYLSSYTAGKGSDMVAYDATRTVKDLLDIFSPYYYAGANATGENIWIGGGGLGSYGTVGDATYGSFNSAIGISSLFNSSTGRYNVAAGWKSLYSNTTGSNNTSAGSNSLYSNTTGSYNSVFGFNALYSNVTGSDNTAFGYNSAYAATGSGNSSFGDQSLSATIAGAENVAVGRDAGRSNTTGSNNTWIGSGAGYSDSQEIAADNSIAIGYQTYTTASNQTVIGNIDTTQSIIYGDLSIISNTTLGSETLYNVDFSILIPKWFYPGDFNIIGDAAVYAHSSGTGSLYQTIVDMAGSPVESSLYKFTYTVSGSVAGCTAEITTDYAEIAQPLDLTDGTHSLYFRSRSAAIILFKISATSTAGGFTLDDLSLKQVIGGSITINGTATIPQLKSTSGTRYLCIDTDGLISSSASACSGT
jgi:hypothetical protein